MRRRAHFHCSTPELHLAGFFFLGLVLCVICPSGPIGGEAKVGRPITVVAHVACTSRIMFWLTPTVVSIHRDTPSPRPIIGELVGILMFQLRATMLICDGSSGRGAATEAPFPARKEPAR